MKKFLPLLLCILLSVSCKAIDSLEQRMDVVEDKIAALEQRCDELNSNILALQTIIRALEQKVYVTSVTEIIEEGKLVGYTIKFTSGEPATIYHGKDGYTPVIGTKRDVDNIYYWTLDGEWLTDTDGNKIKAVGIDGEDGDKGDKGDTGDNGKDGVTPQFQIINNYWCISYDNGATWTQLSKAVGEDGVDGKDGQKGDKGDKGDSMFQSVTVNEATGVVIFTLADGTQVQVPVDVRNIVSKIQAVSFIPRYESGRAVAVGSVGDYGAGSVGLDFAISPKSLVPTIVERWNEMVSVQAVSLISRSAEYFNMPILSISSDAEKGNISVCASIKDLNPEFLTREQSLAVALHISDGDYDMVSDYVPLDHKLTRVIAHRGYWKATSDDPAKQAQNSIAGLLAADAAGIWGCEFDVWQTADGVIVIHHDPALSNGIDIQSANYADIKDFTLPNGEVLPTLESYLTTYKEKGLKTKLIMEFKTHATDAQNIKVVQDAMAMINKMELRPNVEYIAFSTICCDEVVRQNRQARVSLLCDASNCNVADFVQRGYTGIDIHINGLWQVVPPCVPTARAMGLEINSWTISHEDGIKLAVDNGVDFLTTDEPEYAMQVIANICKK